MSYDAHKNFAVSAVAIAPSPPASGTSLTVTAGQGSLFPATPFNATIWPTGQTATFLNAEIVRVTNVTGDVLTITRLQEGSSARTVLVGDLIANTITSKVLTDVEAPRTSPVEHADIPGPVTTTSATLVDIPSSTIQLTNTTSAVLLVWLTITADLNPGTNSTIGAAISIDGVDSNETQVFISGGTAWVCVHITEASGVASAVPIAPGLHTVKGRYRRVSGTGTIEINGGEITALFCQTL